MKINQKIILIDPVFSSRASIVSFAGPKRFSELKPIEIDNFKKIDVVLISHDHYDHLDYKTIKKIKNITNQFIVPLGVGAHLHRWGVDKDKIKELYWHESTEYEGIKFISTPARHFSGRGLFNRNSTLWSSWVITNGIKNIFYSGDSGFDSTISKQIGDNYGPFDLTFMEYGQYNEQWQHIHSFPEKIVEAQRLLKGKILLPIHWGMFKLSLHSWKEPIERLLLSANRSDIKVTTPQLGEEIIIDSLYPNSRWWENIK